MFEHYKQDPDIEAVREGRALPIPDSFAEDKEMREAFVASLSKMSENDLIDLQSALYDLSRQARGDKEVALQDYLEKRVPLGQDVVAKIVNLVQGRGTMPSSTENFLSKGDRALATAARLEAVRDMTGAVMQERAKYFPNRAA